MYRYNRLSGSTKDLNTLYNSALARYKRGDIVGGADTLRNMARRVNPSANFYTLQPTEGTIEDAIAAYSNNKPKLTSRILKYLSLQMHYGKLAA